MSFHAKVWKKLYSTQEPHGFSHREVQDTDGVEDYQTVLGKDAYVQNGIKEVNVDTKRVKQVLNEIVR